MRATMEYLAGRIEPAEFEHWAPLDAMQQLRRNLELGKRISKISIASHSGRDDGLVITFAKPD